MSRYELNGLERKIKGAIWAYFFRSTPDMTRLVVEGVKAEAPDRGSARLSLSRGDEENQLEVHWELDEDSTVLVKPPCLLTNPLTLPID